MLHQTLDHSKFQRTPNGLENIVRENWYILGNTPYISVYLPPQMIKSLINMLLNSKVITFPRPVDYISTKWAYSSASRNFSVRSRSISGSGFKGSPDMGSRGWCPGRMRNFQFFKIKEKLQSLRCFGFLIIFIEILPFFQIFLKIYSDFLQIFGKKFGRNWKEKTMEKLLVNTNFSKPTEPLEMELP